MLCIAMNLDMMSWCVLLFCRTISCWCHAAVMSSDTFMCAKEQSSAALSSMRPYIYLKTLYSSFLGVLCFIRFMLNSKGSFLKPCSKNTRWPARTEPCFSVQAWSECDALTCAGFYSKYMLTELSFVLSVFHFVCLRALQPSWRFYLFSYDTKVSLLAKWGFVETAWKNQLEYVENYKQISLWYHFPAKVCFVYDFRCVTDVQ